jgi:hypothetical protein
MEKTTNQSQQGILYVASALVLIMGLILYFLSDYTETYFAWTIAVPLTASFLGAGYLASFILEFMAARETLWSRSRIAVPAVLLFTSLTFIITLIHIDKFHLGVSNTLTLILTWAWIVVYALVPFIMGFILIQQLRSKGTDSPRLAPLPRIFKLVLGIQAAVMLVLGAVFLLFPAESLQIWPWNLTPLTARAIGAWLVGMGVAGTQSIVENDWLRLRAAMLSYATYGALQIINLFRYPNAEGIDWSAADIWLYVVFVLSILGIGLFGSWQVQKHREV